MRFRVGSLARAECGFSAAGRFCRAFAELRSFLHVNPSVNYFAMRYPGIYGKTAEEFARDFSLTGVAVRPSPVGNTRNIVDVIFASTSRNTPILPRSALCVAT
jgi:hypothetical protein